jgi:hypothetical protein
MAYPGKNFNVDDAVNVFLGSGQEIHIHVAGNCRHRGLGFYFLRWQKTTWCNHLGCGCC